MGSTEHDGLVCLPENSLMARCLFRPNPPQFRCLSHHFHIISRTYSTLAFSTTRKQKVVRSISSLSTSRVGRSNSAPFSLSCNAQSTLYGFIFILSWFFPSPEIPFKMVLQIPMCRFLCSIPSGPYFHTFRTVESRAPLQQSTRS